MAKDIPKKGIELKEIPYIVVIDDDGRFVRFESKRIDKKRSVQFAVKKAVSRTSAPITNVLWDNGKYVFGFEESHKRCNDLFVDCVKTIAERHPEDKSIIALTKFYEIPLGDRQEAMAKDPLYNEVMDSLSVNFSFRLEREDLIIAEKDYLFNDLSDHDDKSSISGRCLVTGDEGILVRTTTATPIPDTSPMASLVSFQVKSGYDSYGKTQAYNAPISEDAEFYITAALKSLLGKDSRNKVRIGNRMFLFWGSGNAEIDSRVGEGLSFLLDISESKSNVKSQQGDKVLKLFKSIFSGEIKTSLKDRFHILGLAPNTGRIAVVLWVDCELREFARHIFRHFEDLEIQDYRKIENRRSYYGVYSMISSVTRGGKLSDATPNLIDGTVQAVLNGTDYPMPLFHMAIERIRAELQDGGVSIQRAAILKAYINRRYKHDNSHKQLTTMLDKTNTNPGYLCGRLAAVLEKIQKDAGSGDSIRTRYMGAASSTPATVFPAMLNVSLHQSEKLSEGSRIYYEQLKQEIIDKLPVDGFPSHLELNDQGRFFVGYYHQNADFYTKKEEKA